MGSFLAPVFFGGNSNDATKENDLLFAGGTGVIDPSAKPIAFLKERLERDGRGADDCEKTQCETRMDRIVFAPGWSARRRRYPENSASVEPVKTREYVAWMERTMSAAEDGPVSGMVSVVVPNYNYRRFLKKRLFSIFSQTRRDMEIVFLDDCSTDGSVALAGDLLSRCGLPYSVHVNSANSGSAFSQWSKGLSLAKGEYVWFAEADDAAAPPFLEKTLAIMEKDPGVALAYTASSVIDEKNRLIDPGFYKRLHGIVSATKWDSDYTNDGEDEIRESLFVMNTIPNASAVVMRADALKAAGGIPAGYVLSGDWLTYVKLLLGGRLAYIDQTLNYNRLHGKRVTWLHDKSELYFKESLAIAEYIVSRIAVPDSSKIKYLDNLFRQIVSGGGRFMVSSEIISKIIRLFSPALVSATMPEIRQ